MSLSIGITGADGLIGWHVRAFLRTFRPQVDVRLATRPTFENADTLAQFTHGLDAIVHCAGVNRGKDSKVETVNIELAHKLVQACESAMRDGGHYPDVVYTNSTHAGSNTAYGRGKQDAAVLLLEASARNGGRCANLILPHVFGEFGKPFYNSVVSTFCHQLAVGEITRINVDGDLELVHAQTVAARCIAAVEGREKGDLRMGGSPLKVSELHEKLKAMAESYFSRNIVPDLRDRHDQALFNTLRSYRFPEHARSTPVLHRDDRGTLFEAVKSDNGGQAFLSTTHPGVTRGNHFHSYKFERFLVCKGEAEIRLRRLFSDQIHSLNVSGDSPQCIDIPTFYTHDISNTGAGELVTLFWANEIFEPDRSDTFSEMVLP